MTKAPEKLNAAIIMLCLMAFYTLKAYRIIFAQRGNRGERLNYAHIIDKKKKTSASSLQHTYVRGKTSELGRSPLVSKRH
jgi:hypothetical protein